MGSIRHRHDRNRFQLDYVDADGIRRRPFCAEGTSEAQAKRQLRDIEAGVRSGLAPVRKYSSGLTLDEVSVRWLEAGRNKWAPQTIDTRLRFVVKYISPALGRRAVDEVTTEDLAVWMDALPLQPSTQRMLRGMVRMIYRWAIARGLATADPARDLKPPRVPRTIPHYLTPEQYEALLEVTTGDIRDGAILSVRTGVRAGELLALRWSDVQGTAIVVSRSLDKLTGRPGPTKGRKARRIPLHPEAQGVLSTRTRGRGRVLPLTYHGWRLALTRALRRVGVDQGGPHLLRHTCASWWVQNGGSLMALQRLLGHATLDMTLIYAHLAPDSVEQEAARAWGLLGTGSVRNSA